MSGSATVISFEAEQEMPFSEGGSPCNAKADPGATGSTAFVHGT